MVDLSSTARRPSRNATQQLRRQTPLRRSRILASWAAYRRCRGTSGAAPGGGIDGGDPTAFLPEKDTRLLVKPARFIVDVKLLRLGVRGRAVHRRREPDGAPSRSCARPGTRSANAVRWGRLPAAAGAPHGIG